MLMLLGMSVDLWEEWVLLMIGKLIKSWVQFVKRMQKEGEEFAKSIKVSFTKEVAAWRLDRLDAVQQLEFADFDEEEMLQLEQGLKVCVGNVA